MTRMPVTGNAGPTQVFVIASDLSNDGSLDVATCSAFNFQVYLNTGGGVFDGGTIFGTHSYCLSLLAEDFNMDGAIDVAVYGNNENRVWVYVNSPSMPGEAFTRDLIYSGPMYANYGVLRAADVDQDGFIDLVVNVGNHDLLYWIANNGSGLQPISPAAPMNVIAAGTDCRAPFSTAVGDFAGNGRVDVAVGLSRYLSGDPFSLVVLYRNNGSGGFDPASIISTHPTFSFESFDLQAGDLDGDGTLDLVSCSSGGNLLSWYPNNGDGTWPRGRVVISTSASQIQRIALGDINGDGALDIAATAGTSPSAVWFMNDGTGSFANGKYTVTDSEPVALSIILADIDANGALDVVASFNSVVAWFASSSGVSYSPPRSVSPCCLGSFFAFAAADLNLDGYPDVLAATRDTQLLEVFINSGIGGFLPGRRTITTQLSTSSVALVADVNGDGALDAVVTQSFGGTSVAVWFANDGTGSFGPARNISDAASVAAIGDLDGDRAIDVVLFNEDLTVAWARNNGTGAWAAPESLSITLGYPSRAAVADVTGDGAADILVVASISALYLLENVYGNGTFFQARDTGGFYEGLTFVLPADFTSDGILDVIVVTTRSITNYQYETIVSMLPGLGAGAFNTPGTDLIADSSYGIVYMAAAADVDNDGTLDVIIPSRYNQRTILFLGDGAGNFAGPSTVSMGNINDWVAVADLDNDGLVDVVQSSYTNRDVQWVPAVPSMRALRTPKMPLLPAECGGVPGTAACLAASVVHLSSGCFPARIRLPPAVQGCLLSPLLLSALKPVIIEPAAPAANTATITCAVGTARVLFSVGTGVALTLNRLTIEAVSAARAAPQGPTRSLIELCQAASVADESATVTLNNVTVRGFTNRGLYAQSPFSRGLGAVSVFAQSRLSVVGCVFEGNSCDLVGAAVTVVGDGATVTISESRFTNNLAGGNHNGPLGGGGGGALAVAGAGCVVTAEHCEFSGNQALRGDGGAVLLLPTATNAAVSIRNSNFLASSAALAGGAVASVGAVGSTLSLQDCTLSGSRAAYGGSAAAVSSELAASSLLSRTTMALMPRGQGTAAGGTVSISGGGGGVSDSVADYGGAVFVCGAVVNLTVLLADVDARVGGGLAFFCNPNSPGAPPQSWLTASAGAAAAATVAADGYAARNGTPPLRIVTDGFRSAAVSGVALGGGVAWLEDAYGQRVRDASILLRAEVPASASVAGASLAAAARESGDYDFSAFAIRAIGWPGSLGGSATIGITVLGAEGLSYVPTAAVTLAVRGCPTGWGRVSEAGAATPLVCARCADAPADSVADGSEAGGVEPCTVAPNCGGNTILAGGVCVACPAGTAKAVSNDSSAVVCACQVGFWSPTATTGSECQPCPIGGVCAGGVAAPTAAGGFFPDRDATGAAVFVACPNKQACLGGGRCAAGYSGRLCGSCASNWYALNGRCYRCKPAQTGGVTAALVVGALLVSAALLWFNLGSYAHRFVAASIGLQGLQISAMFGKLDLDWGPFADAYFNILSALNVNFQLSSPECSLARGLDAWTVKWLLTMALPVFAAASLAVVGGLFALLSRAKIGKFADFNTAQIVDGFKRSWTQALTLLYLPLTAGAFVLFGCRRDVSGRWILTDVPSRQCYDARWRRLLAPALIFVLLYSLALPLSLFAIVRRAHRSLEHGEFLLRFGFLVGRFNDRAWGYEAANMALKFGVVVSMTFFFTDSGRAAGALFVLVAGIVAVAFVRPYRTVFHNGLAAAVLGATAAVLFGGIIADFALRRFTIICGVVITICAVVGGNALDLWAMRRVEQAAARKWAADAVDAAFVLTDVDAPVLRNAYSHGVVGGATGVPMVSQESVMPVLSMPGESARELDSSVCWAAGELVSMTDVEMDTVEVGSLAGSTMRTRPAAP